MWGFSAGTHPVDGGVKVPSDDVKKLKTLLKPGGKKKKKLHVVLKVFKTQEVGL